MKGEIFNFVLFSEIGTVTDVADKDFILIGMYFQNHDIN